MKRALSIAFAMGFAALGHAQVRPSLMDFARPTLQWYTLETEHFVVVFHEGASRSAQVAARIAEEVYGPITELYGHQPATRVHIVIKDFEDYSNGAAYFFDNKIEIWAPALDSSLRGDHAWLRNVITHEFTHIVQVQAAMKGPRTWPLTYLQVLDYERVRRPDVLYGYPNVILSYPIIALSNPAWLAEGTAQYQRSTLDYDQWDSHRDMMLRTQIMAGKELTLTEMGSFYSKNSLQREAVYNHGYAFTRYLAARYGESVLASITRAQSGWSRWKVEQAIHDATGESGRAVYTDWIEALRNDYREALGPVVQDLVPGRLVQEEGFANYYPVFSPDRSKLAYVSNRGEHHGRLSLHVQDLEEGGAFTHDLGPAPQIHARMSGHVLRAGVTGGASWHPDGTSLVYGRQKTDPFGYLHTDLYTIDVETRESTRLTHGARAMHPAWSPDGTRIAFVAQGDGTTNLKVRYVRTDSVATVTRFEDGTQVTRPAWDGEWIYFARLEPGGHGRDLWRVQADGSAMEPILVTEHDERDPAVHEGVLYYASDANGIYNLYRLGSSGPELLTRVSGGAFMPSVGSDGAVAYAHYQWDGYKVAILEQPKALESAVQYKVPTILAKDADPVRPHPADADVRPLTATDYVAVRAEGKPITSDSLSVARYGAAFMQFSITPVIRLDQYVDRRLAGRTRAQGAWRNLKLGTYASSREMLEGISLFGGLMAGPGSGSEDTFLAPSNLLSLERDAFIQFEYRRGFRFIPKRWSPQIALELYNIQRRVEDGLEIEEFPCTACLPDTTHTDLTYGLWQGDVWLRSKVNRNAVVEVGYRYSPYRVNTDRFYSRELQTTIPSSSSRYFIGRSYLANVYVEMLRSHRESDLMPEGFTAHLGYEYESGRLLRRFDIQGGQLVPIHERDAMHRLRLDVRAGMRLPGRIRGATHGVGLRVNATTLFGERVDSFYNEYLGGLIGVRGYPFYALGGTEAIWTQLSWTVPVWPDIARELGPIYFDKVFLRLYADAVRIRPYGHSWHKDVGAEMRVKLGSAYLLPTAVFLSSTYGMDAFEVELDEAFLATRRAVAYGRSVQWHFGVLFGFDL